MIGAEEVCRSVLSLVELHILDVSHLFEQRYPVQSLARKYVVGLMTG